jgi:hypothetical protein
LKDGHSIFSKSVGLLLLTILILSLNVNVGSTGQNNYSISKNVFYYFDYAYIVYSNNETLGYFETPINYSDGTVNQTVTTIAIGGKARIVNSTPPYAMNMTNNTYGYVVLKITQQVKNVSGVVFEIVKNPLIFTGVYNNTPPEIRSKYIKEQVTIVNTTVRDAFESWLKKNGYLPSNVSKAFLGVAAAIFIYGQYYIKYSASALPRSIEDVVENRTGDCDDMSRVLINLLWGYGIPAKIQYSYVYLPFNSTFDVEGSYITYINAGPHAYVLMYIPSLGWVSLDFLAGALINYPSIITGETTEANVTNKDVEELKKELNLYRYAEILELYPEGSVPEDLLQALKAGNLSNILYPKISKYVESIQESLATQNPPQNSSRINTTTTTTAPATHTEFNTTTSTTTSSTQPPTTSTSEYTYPRITSTTSSSSSENPINQTTSPHTTLNKSSYTKPEPTTMTYNRYLLQAAIAILIGVAVLLLAASLKHHH